MSQSQLNQKLNDREKCVHSIVSLTGFFRRDSVSEPDPEMFRYLLETTRVAMFSKITAEEMWEIADECDKQDKSMRKLSQNMQEYLKINR
jgi:hypothetical protein